MRLCGRSTGRRGGCRGSSVMNSDGLQAAGSARGSRGETVCVQLRSSWLCITRIRTSAGFKAGAFRGYADPQGFSAVTVT
jgi:hypothetical protein